MKHFSMSDFPRPYTARMKALEPKPSIYFTLILRLGYIRFYRIIYTALLSSKEVYTYPEFLIFENV